MAPDDQRGGMLRVVVAGDEGSPLSVPGLARWLERVAPVRAQGSVSVALVGDARVRALNKRYRKRDYATDVLSFPAFARPRSHRAARLADQPPPRPRRSAEALRAKAEAPAVRGRTTGPKEPYLGDIVIARGVARRQARAAGHSEQTELRILALHGLLHLLGYDHERDGGAMARLERKLRLEGGLPSGLIERGPPVPDTRERNAATLQQAQGRSARRRRPRASGAGAGPRATER